MIGAAAYYKLKNKKSFEKNKYDIDAESTKEKNRK